MAPTDRLYPDHAASPERLSPSEYLREHGPDGTPRIRHTHSPESAVAIEEDALDLGLRQVGAFGYIADADKLRAENARLRAVAGALVSQWHEFGPEYQFEEAVAMLEAALAPASEAVKMTCPSDRHGKGCDHEPSCFAPPKPEAAPDLVRCDSCEAERPRAEIDHHSASGVNLCKDGKHVPEGLTRLFGEMGVVDSLRAQLAAANARVKELEADLAVDRADKGLGAEVRAATERAEKAERERDENGLDADAEQFARLRAEAAHAKTKAKLEAERKRREMFARVAYGAADAIGAKAGTDFDAVPGMIQSLVKELEVERKAHGETKALDQAKLTWLDNERDALAKQLEEAEGALLKLSNEAHGFLSMAEPSTHGWTNIKVLRLRIDEARAFLAAHDKAGTNA